MQACEHLRENLTLYVYGELDPVGGREVENHLAMCAECRHEHRQLRSLLVKVRETRAIPELSPRDGRAMAAEISRKLNAERKGSRWWQFPDFWPPRMVPAAAIAAAFLLTFAVLGYLSLNKTTEMTPVSMTPNEEIMLSDKDLEILDNLELLKEMDAIQKLSRVVSSDSETDLQWDIDNDTRGMRRGAYGQDVV